jgi:Dolichyl-phosphate-mannose-protein mannosyltransferase
MQFSLRRYTSALVLSLGSLAYIWLAAAVRTGNNPASKLRMLLLEYLFLLPVMLLVLFWERRGSPGRPSGPPRLGIALAMFAAAALVPAYAVRKGIYNADESAYLFQSKALESGELAAHAPPRTAPDPETYQRDFFFENHVIHQGKWFGKYPPGWPALLAAALEIDAGWLLNPLFGLLTLWLTYRIARRIFDERVARIAAWILVLSPFFVLNCVGYMSHPACAAAIAGATLLLAESSDPGRLRRFAAMFALLACTFLMRPATGAAAGLVLTSALLYRLRSNRRLFTQTLATGALLGAAAGTALLFHNRAMTGGFLLSPYALGRNAELPVEVDLRPANLLHNAGAITSVSLAKTVLDAAPFVFLLAAWTAFRERRYWSLVLAALFLLIVAAYLPQTEVSDSVIGERYYFEAYFGIAILAARGWTLVTERRRAGVAYALAVSIVAVQLFHYGLLAATVLRLKTGYGRVLDAVAGLHLDRAVVLMDPAPGFAAKNFNPNEADWEHAPLFFVRDPGPLRREEFACALGRPHWVLVSYREDRRAAVIEGRGEAACADVQVRTDDASGF